MGDHVWHWGVPTPRACITAVSQRAFPGGASAILAAAYARRRVDSGAGADGGGTSRAVAEYGGAHVLMDAQSAAEASLDAAAGDAYVSATPVASGRSPACASLPPSARPPPDNIHPPPGHPTCSPPDHSPCLPPDDELRVRFASDGYVRLPGAFPPSLATDLAQHVSSQHRAHGTFMAYEMGYGYFRSDGAARFDASHAQASATRPNTTP
jgi:hypothetical protein